jgi:hypothetical protein
MNTRQIENSQSFILAVEFLADGQLSPHWQYVCQTFCSTSLNGKTFAVFVALGNSQDHGRAADAFRSELRNCGARVVGDLSYVGSPQWNTDNWVCVVSPNL